MVYQRRLENDMKDNLNFLFHIKRTEIYFHLIVQCNKMDMSQVPYTPFLSVKSENIDA